MDRWGRVKQPLRAMQPRAVADAIRSRAAAAGIDRASGHSLRVGAAVSMAQRGASLVAMQQAGGWRSPDTPREAWPQGVGWLHASIGGFRPVAGRQRLPFNCPHVDTPLGQQLKAPPARRMMPYPHLFRVASAPCPRRKWFARSR